MHGQQTLISREQSAYYRSHLQQTTNPKYIRHYLAYVESHARTDGVDFDALEQKRGQVLDAMDVAFRSGEWQAVRRFARVICAPSSGWLSIHGYWQELHARLIQAGQAALAEGHPADGVAFGVDLATVKLMTGDLADARRIYEQAIPVYAEWKGADKQLAAVYHQLGMMAQEMGDLNEAHSHYQHSLQIKQTLGDSAGQAKTLHNLGLLCHMQGEIEEALRYYQLGFCLEVELGDVAGQAGSAHQLGRIYEDRGDLEQAESF